MNRRTLKSRPNVKEIIQMERTECSESGSVSCSGIPPKISEAKEKQSFDLKKYQSKEFRNKGYYVDTVGISGIKKMPHQIK